MPGAYDEQTLIHLPTLGQVYGQDGFGWYCDRDTAALFPNIKPKEGKNPLFVTLPGMTRAKLRKAGFVPSCNR